MKRSYLETLSRHKALCAAPVVVAAALGGLYAHSRAPQYVASASIFADAPLSDPSTVGTTGGIAPPSGGQQALLNNFNATRSFLLTVARKSGLPGFSASEPAPQLERSLAALSSSITTVTPGPNLMVVRVTRPNPTEATRLASSLVDTFLSLERDTIQRRTASQLSDANKQLTAAGTAVDDAQKALTGYVQAHPQAQARTDAQLGALSATVSHAQDQYTASQKALQSTVANAPVVDASNLFVVDRPTAAYSKGHTKALIIGGGGGLLAGISIALVALMLLVSRDTFLRTAGDVEEELHLPVVGEIGVLPKKRRRTSGGRAGGWRTPSVAASAFSAGPAAGEALTATRTATDVLVPLTDWVPAEVVAACRRALRHLKGGAGTVAVSAPTFNAGCTTVALGTVLAKREDFEQPTILLDLNFWDPAVAKIVGGEGAPGVAELLRGEATLDDVLIWADPFVGVVTAGAVDDPQRLLAQFKQSSLLTDLAGRGYSVVADLPPLPPEGRGDRVVEMFWNLLMVVRCGDTSVVQAKEATAALSTPTSVVLNGCATTLPRASGPARAG